MTTAAQLVAFLRSQEVVITANGGRVRMRAPRGVVTKSVQFAVRQQRAEILALLRAETACPPAASLGPAGRRGTRVEQIRAIACERGLGADLSLLGRQATEVPDLHEARLDEDDVVEPTALLGAALLRSINYGEVRLVFDLAMVGELAAEEARRPDPRPILLAEDVARLRGKPESAIRAALETARVWPGARVVQ